MHSPTQYSTSMYSPTLCSYLSHWAERWPERLAIKCIDDSLSWGALDRSSSAIATYLVSQGVCKGDRVGILMHNRVEFIEAIFGTLRAGAIVTLLNIRNTPSELQYPLNDAGIRLVFSEPCFDATLRECRAAIPALKIISTAAGEGDASLPILRSLTPDPALLSGLHTTREDTAFICYTSGTTGQPKGAMLSHANLIEASWARTMVSGVCYRDNVLLALPMAYTGGLCVYIRDTFIPGATLFLEATVDPERMLDVIEQDRISLWPGVPIVFEKVLSLPRFRTADYSSLKHVVVGGASVSLHLIEEFAKIGVGVTQGYGLTESSGSYVAILTEEFAASKIGFTGRAVVNARLRVVDAAGNDQPAGVAGEILVSGPTVMQGYFNKPEATRKAIVDGWLHTGDVGLFDEEGFLKIVDRKKDMLISGGLNVYPAEIEHVLAGVGGMEEFVVIGVPDPKWGEVPMIVAHSEQPLNVDQLIARCTEYLSDYKRPKYFYEFGEPLPRTYSGKILKRAVQDRIQGVPGEAVELKQTSKRQAS